jgi:RecB family endonuclease NucS
MLPPDAPPRRRCSVSYTGRLSTVLPEAVRLRMAFQGCRGVLAAQAIKPHARLLAGARGIDCVEVDLAVLRGEREPDLRLFAA